MAEIVVDVGDVPAVGGGDADVAGAVDGRVVADAIADAAVPAGEEGTRDFSPWITRITPNLKATA